MRPIKIKLRPPTEAEREDYRADKVARRIADGIGGLHYAAVNLIACLGEFTSLFKFVDTPNHAGMVFVVTSIDYPVYQFIGRAVPLGGGPFWFEIIKAQVTFVPATLLYWFIAYFFLRLLMKIGG